MPPAVPDNRPMTRYRQAYDGILLAIHNAATRDHRPPARLLAVSKTRTAAEVAALAAAGQRAFGENYVQEALPKIEALRALGLEWHLIGHQIGRAHV